MRPNRKAMRLIAQPLDKIEHRVIALQREGTRPKAVELLLTRITIDTFGDTDKGHIVNTKILHDLGNGTDLPFPTINEQ